MGTKQCNRSEKGAFERVSVAPASELFQVVVGFEQLFTHIIFHENVAFTLYSGTLVAGGRMFPPVQDTSQRHCTTFDEEVRTNRSL